MILKGHNHIKKLRNSNFRRTYSILEVHTTMSYGLNYFSSNMTAVRARMSCIRIRHQIRIRKLRQNSEHLRHTMSANIEKMSQKCHKLRSSRQKKYNQEFYPTFARQNTDRYHRQTDDSNQQFKKISNKHACMKKM